MEGGTITLIILFLIIFLGVGGFLVYWFVFKKNTIICKSKFTSKEYMDLKEKFPTADPSDINFSEATRNTDSKLIISLYQIIKDGDSLPSAIGIMNVEREDKDFKNSKVTVIRCIIPKTEPKKSRLGIIIDNNPLNRDDPEQKGNKDEEYIFIVMRSTLPIDDTTNKILKDEVVTVDFVGKPSRLPKFINESSEEIYPYCINQINKNNPLRKQKMITIIADNELGSIGLRVSRQYINLHNDLKNTVVNITIGELPTFISLPSLSLENSFSIVSDKDPYYIKLKDSHKLSSERNPIQPDDTYECINDYRSTLHYYKYLLRN